MPRLIYLHFLKCRHHAALTEVQLEVVFSMFKSNWTPKIANHRT